MRAHVWIEPLHRLSDPAYTVVRPARRRRPRIRTRPPVPHPAPSVQPLPSSAPAVTEPDPYVDYGRFHTAEGGVLIVYKDLDLSLPHAIWCMFAWITSTGLEGWFLLNLSPLRSGVVTLGAFLLLAWINWLIVAKPVEVHRRIEIRPDCMIIDGEDLFWRQRMEGAWPALKETATGGQVLSGIYGTRFVEYLTVRRFDEWDRTPEVFAMHLREAMHQLWTGFPA